MKLQLKKCGPVLKMGKKDRYPLHRKGKANNEYTYKNMSNFTCNQEKAEIPFCTQNIGHSFKDWQINVLMRMKENRNS